MAQRSRRLLLSVCALVLLIASATPVLAASDDQNPASGSQYAPPPNADFFLGRPRVTFGARGNWIFASAGSDIYDFVTEHLTLEKSSFNAPSFTSEVNVTITSRLDVSVGFDLSQSSSPSHYREKSEQVGDRFLPIEQTTELKKKSVTAGVRFAVLPAGRRISRFAWIPSRMTPYVTGGGGILNYSFEQFGDFVDFTNNRIFTDNFKSAGWTPLVYAGGGVDIHVFRRVFMSLDGRYHWSSGSLDQDFVDFDPIDLKGFRFGAGFHYAF
jgi:hypothetical protein